MSATTPARRACITGYGALSPIGNSAPAFWEALVAGRCGLEPLRTFDTTGMSVTLAGEVKDFEPAERLLPAEIARLDRSHQFGLSTAREALAAAHLDLAGVDGSRVGVIVSTSVGAMRIGEAYQRHLAGAGGAFDPLRLFDFPYYATANILARLLGVRGPVVSPSIACASGTQAVGQALEFIRRGHGDVFLVGGVEALCAFVVNGFNCLRATTAEVVRPFDARRSGLLLGEGAAMLIVEEREHARARGAPVDVEVTGSGLAGDATHMTAPARDGAGAARARRMALADAGVSPADVDFISAHGTGTVYNDAMEVAAIDGVFGPAAAGVPVNSIKGAIGHTLAAAGAFEAIMCAQILRTDIIPATLGCEQLDPGCALDVVRGAPRRHPVRVALSTSSAFAGNNAAIVLEKAAES
jgi:3-oxoacyl-[acyl-carrier-protein] synthase II